MKLLPILLLGLASCASAQVAIVAPPPQPTLAPTLAWGTVAGATNYLVEGSVDDTNWTWYYNTGTNLTMQATNLPVAGSSYFFRCAAEASPLNISPWTPTLQWTPEPTPANFTTK